MELPNAKFSAAAEMGGILLDHRHLAWVLPHRCLLFHHVQEEALYLSAAALELRVPLMQPAAYPSYSSMFSQIF